MRLLILAQFNIPAGMLCLRRGIITAGVVSIVRFVRPRCILIDLIIILSIVELEYRWLLLLTTSFGNPPCRIGEDGVAALSLEAWARCASLRGQVYTIYPCFSAY